MPRRHRKLDLTPPRPPPQGPPPPAPRDAEILEAAQALLPAARLVDGAGLGRRQRVKLRVRWSRDTPAQALRLARLLSLEGAALAALPFDAAELCAREERVRRLQTLRELLEHLADQAADLLLAEKAALHGQVRLGARAVEALLDGPLTSGAAKARLRPRAAPLLGAQEARRAAIQREKRRRAALRAAAVAQATPVLPPALDPQAAGAIDCPDPTTPCPAEPPHDQEQEVPLRHLRAHL
jgi:hypothetical protein